MSNAIAQKTQPTITIHDRLEYGKLSIDEVCTLAIRSKTGFYQDVKAGLVKIEKTAAKAPFLDLSPSGTSLANQSI